MNQSTPLPADPTAGNRPDAAQELLRRWWLGQSPNVHDFLTQACDLSLDEIVTVLQVDQLARWERGECIFAEAYLEKYPQLAAEPEIAMDLVYGEFLLREELGEAPALEDYVRRFPEHADSIRLQIQFHRAVDESKATPSATAPEEEQDQQEAPLWSPEGYEILGVLGQGGMGVVYKARQKGLNRIVALKMILVAEHANADQLTRFRAEAETVALLQHPNIVQIYEVGKHAGRPYFSLEYVDGGNLAQRIAGNPLPPRAAAELIETLARAMHYAHQRGVVHRDLKPANVLIAGVRSQESGVRSQKSGHSSQELGVGSQRVANEPIARHIPLSPDSCNLTPVPKITDFGLAKHLDSGVLQTQSGAILGTPGYMAPEQAAEHTRVAGPAVDIYALGAILYELVTGRPPFQAASILEALELIRHVEPVPPRRLHQAAARQYRLSQHLGRRPLSSGPSR